MWLINCNAYLLEFFHEPTVKYVILSHTWRDGEVTFKDIANLDHACQLEGFDKIRGTCAWALRFGFKYAWVDTCCIDKSSSAELSEAINSMFYWYQKSAACIVFFDDLPPSPTGADTIATEDELRECRWFTRGWTLQELIAPSSITFLDRTWTFRGDKKRLCPILSLITSIPVEVLSQTRPLDNIAVAQRLSWASGRYTTRIEDEAYCLMGLFDINMPLLYGEREKAFVRLQQAIVQQTGDLSIFAWNNLHVKKDALYRSSPFADTPWNFGTCTLVERLDGIALPRPSVVSTSAGIQFSTSIAGRFINRNRVELLHLQCRVKLGTGGQSNNSNLVMVLPILPTPRGYIRHPDWGVQQFPQWELDFQPMKEISLTRPESAISRNSPKDTTKDRRLRIKLSLGRQFDMDLLRYYDKHWSYYPTHLWDSGDESFFLDEHSDVFFGAVRIGMRAESDLDPNYKSLSRPADQCWLFCCLVDGRVQVAIFNNPTNTRIIKFPGFQPQRLGNPYYLSNLGHLFRGAARDGEVFPTKCSIKNGGVDITVSWRVGNDMADNPESRDIPGSGYIHILKT